jgi:hypothetical protein
VEPFRHRELQTTESSRELVLLGVKMGMGCEEGSRQVPWLSQSLWKHFLQNHLGASGRKK